MSRSVSAVVWLHLRLVWRSALGWGVAVGATIGLTVAGYQTSYPTPLLRELLRQQVDKNPAFLTLYGQAPAVDTTGGFVSWRLGILIAALSAGWGILTASRLTRGEEEAGRAATLLVGSIGPCSLLGAQLASVAIAATGLGGSIVVASMLAGLRPTGSVLLAGVAVANAVLFAAIAAVTAQFTTRRRVTSLVAGSALASALLMRIASDATRGPRWLRWATPVGWTQQVHPFADDNPWPLALSLAAALILVAVALGLRARRDDGEALLAAHRRRRASVRPVSTLRLAMQAGRGQLVVWSVAVAIFSFVFGLLSSDLADFARHDAGSSVLLARFGLGSLVTATGFVGLSYHYLALAIAVFAAMQPALTRDEELSGRLDLLLAGPLFRSRWLAQRMVAGTVSVLVVVLTSGVATWTGAVVGGADVSAFDAVAGAVNCVPIGLLFLGVGFLAVAVAPRPALAITMTLVASSYILEIAGILLRAPVSVLNLSPFYRTQLYPAFRADLAGDLGMVAIGLAAAALAAGALDRRDVLTA